MPLAGLPTSSFTPRTYCFPACSKSGVVSVAVGDDGLIVLENTRALVAASQMPIWFAAVEPAE